MQMGPFGTKIFQVGVTSFAFWYIYLW